MPRNEIKFEFDMVFCFGTVCFFFFFSTPIYLQHIAQPVESDRPINNATGPDSSVGRESAPGKGRSRVRSRAATYSAGEEKSPYFLFHGETALCKILKFQGEAPNFSEKFQGEIAEFLRENMELYR